MKQEAICTPIDFSQTSEVWCFPPWYVSDSEYPMDACTYQPLVNGEETFKAVYQAIASATRSIDIIGWGFQPSMYLIRDGASLMLGALLMEKAKAGVKVRVLVWEAIKNFAGGGGETNLPGKSVFNGLVRPWPRALQHTTDSQYAYDCWWFDTCYIANKANHLPGARPIPVFATRGFSMQERDRIAESVEFDSLDPAVKRT